MLINTKFLGTIEIDSQTIINFNGGLPGFQQLHKFVLLPVEENQSLYYLQCVEEESICFVVMSPFFIKDDYEIDISEETVEMLEIDNSEDVSLFVILTIPEDINNMTANLLAPIVINTVNKRAVQEILNNDKYNIKHKLF